MPSYFCYKCQRMFEINVMVPDPAKVLCAACDPEKSNPGKEGKQDHGKKSEAEKNQETIETAVTIVGQYWPDEKLPQDS